MSKLKDGGPAFACASDVGHQAGLSIRDYFAAAALQGMLTQPFDASEGSHAEWAYRYADAMLKEREKE